MELITVYNTMLVPAYRLLPGHLDSPKASVLMLAIGLQESRFTHRVQVNGPAKGFWQFEKGGGVRGVMSHPASEPYVAKVCDATGVNPPSLQNIYDSLATNDVLAAAFARLLLKTDPAPLPAVGEVEQAWQYYIRNWRPGKPHRHTWNELYARAYEFVQGMEVVL